MKNHIKSNSGRLGGLIGWRARSLSLTSQQRSDIAKKAAYIRWSKPKDNMLMKWEKKLSRSDAQETVPVGSKMPFLRFTKERYNVDHLIWFREIFFQNLDWINSADSDEETAEIYIQVTILGANLGLKKMELSHKPSRAKNHSAPTTHLNYDNATRLKLESMDVTGRKVIVSVQNDSYFLEVV